MMQADTIETIGTKSLIQHGAYNQRIYLMKLHHADTLFVLEQMSRMARENHYSKIFCKVPQSEAPVFTAHGFLCEAQIPRFYNQQDAVFFMSKFLNSDRLLNFETEQLTLLSKMLKQPGQSSPAPESTQKYRVKKLGTQHCHAIPNVYRQVFASYPFPIFDARYIAETMADTMTYFGIEVKNQLVALAATETDAIGRNAEMTDFAILPAFRGKKLSELLLEKMEEQMQNMDIKTLYTIARINSIGMNKTFIRAGYTYSGTAVKNTHIAGNIESMNIYYKHL